MRYVSVVQRKRSPFFTVAYFCPKKKTRVWKTTEFRVDDPQGHRKALNWASEKSKEAVADRAAGATDGWASWVPEFLERQYSGRPVTLAKRVSGWAQWQEYLDLQGIRAPRGLDYNAVLKFVEWRKSTPRRSGKCASTNTTLNDVTTMSVIMREARRRGYADSNPCERLGIPRDRSREKREITTEEIAKIREALKTRPEWMRVAFEIALHQGCRHAETSLSFDQIDSERRTIRFTAKGRNGSPHVFTTRLHSGLLPMLRELQSRGLTRTCTFPPMTAIFWWKFFREINLPDLCFHCTRVTAVTRLARAGVPIQQAMAYIGHSSEAVHRIYQKLAAQDLSRAEDALKF